MAANEVIVTLKLDDGQALAQFEKLTQQLTELNLEKKALQKQIRDNDKEFRALNATLNELGGNNKEVQAAIAANRKQFDDLTKTLARTDAAYENVRVQFRESKNDISGATAAGLRFRDVMADAVTNGVTPAFQSLKQAIREAQKEAQIAFQQFGRDSQEFQTAAARVDDLQDSLKEVNISIEAIDFEGKIQTFGRVAEGIAGAFAVAQGAAALFGEENEAVEKAILKVQAALAITQGIESINNAIKASKGLAIAIGLTTTATEAKAAATVVDTAATGAQTVATGAATVATRALGIAMNALPIVAIVTALGTLVYAFMEVSEAEEKQLKILDDLQRGLAQLGQDLQDLATAEDRLAVAQGRLTSEQAARNQLARDFQDEFTKLELQRQRAVEAGNLVDAKAAEARIEVLKQRLSIDQQLSFTEQKKREEDERRKALDAEAEARKRATDEAERQAKAYAKIAEERKMAEREAAGPDFVEPNDPEISREIEKQIILTNTVKAGIDERIAYEKEQEDKAQDARLALTEVRIQKAQELFTQLAQAAGDGTDEQRKFFAIAKALAIAEVAINTQRRLAAQRAASEAASIIAAAAGPASLAAFRIAEVIKSVTIIAQGAASTAAIASQGFATGGYTGDGGKYEPAGVVHRGEFVFNKAATQRIGVENLEWLHELFAGFGAKSPGNYFTGGAVTRGTALVNLSSPTMSADAIARERSIAAASTVTEVPVLVTEDYQRVARRVEVRETRSSL